MPKTDADYVFYELTRSICPDCRRVIDAQVILRNYKVYMRKRCPTCGPFEALVYGDAEAYVADGKYNKPGPSVRVRPDVEAKGGRLLCVSLVRGSAVPLKSKSRSLRNRSP